LERSIKAFRQAIEVGMTSVTEVNKDRFKDFLESLYIFKGI
jgi:hypothetical protein